MKRNANGTHEETHKELRGNSKLYSKVSFVQVEYQVQISYSGRLNTRAPRLLYQDIVS